MHLLNLLCARENIPAKQLSDAAKSMLAALPWRGNGEEATWFAVGGSLREARARFETEYIAAVVAHHHGRIPEAAKSLGIQRSNLYRKMRRLNVRPKAQTAFTS